MKRGVPGSLKAAMVIVGTVIGAGFASGQEIMRFFTGYGTKGLLSIGLSGLLFIWICYRALAGSGTDYEAYLKTLLPGRMAKALEWVTVIFMLFCYGAMLAGSGALMEQEWNWNFYAGLLVMAAVTMGILLAGKSGLVWLNMAIVPLIVVMLIWLSGRSVIESAYLQTTPLALSTVAPFDLRFLADGLLYTSYNLLTLVPVLCTLRSGLKGKNQRMAAAVMGGGILLLLSLILGLASLANYDTMKGMEIPIFALLEDGRMQNLLCCFVLLGAMLTTAVSDGYICVLHLKERGMSGPAAICVITGLGCGIGCMGFSSLVGKVYPAFGILGLILLASIWRRQSIEKRSNFVER